MDAAARLRPFLFVVFAGRLHPRMAWIYLSPARGISIHAWRESTCAGHGGISVDPRHAWMDHSVAVVQYRRVWRDFAPRG
ncbi:hypothetical protein SRABI35_00524 [Stenotrophomonas lactitubi]|jgi:hypothetical protein|nr:hypothetical protein SRABI35_00524 [Stenotrophomonas lactitubi]